MSESSAPAGAVLAETAQDVWGVPLQAAGCPNCGEVHLLPAVRAGGRCPACFAADLVAQPAALRPEPPEQVLPFAVSEAQAADALTRWVQQAWLPPDTLTPAELRARLTRTFVPMWLVDADVAGAWQAQAGFDYEVASTQEVYRDGQWTTHSLTETRIRWEPRTGQLRRAYHNVAVPALDDHARVLAGLGRLPPESAQPYAPEAVAGAAVRVPSLDPQAAWPQARARLDALAVADCQAAAGAQHMEQTQLALDYGRPHWTLLLLPVYTTAYQDDDGRWWPVRINGHTGQLAGVQRASLRKAWRYTLAVALIAAVLLALAAGTLLVPPLLPLTVLLFAAAVVLGLFAPVPVARVYQINARQS